MSIEAPANFAEFRPGRAAPAYDHCMERAMRRIRRSAATLAIPAAVICSLLISIPAFGEYPASTQIYGSQGAPRFANSIQIPSATYATPSEVRMAIHASGATPSELRTNYDRIGPLAASGPIAYVPPPINVYAKPAQPPPPCVYAEFPPGAQTPACGEGSVSQEFVPSPFSVSAAPNQFATGAFSCWFRPGQRFTPAFERWISIGSSLSRRNVRIGQPSSFSASLMSRDPSAVALAGM
jgi:hypothetical protein